MTSQVVPFVDLHLQHQRVADEIATAFAGVIDDTSFVLGPEVVRFEESFAEYTGVAHCIGVANGTDALELAMRAAGVGAGDEVVIPANTFVATAGAVARCGASIVLADCDENHLVDPESVARCVTPQTKAVIPV